MSENEKYTPTDEQVRHAYLDHRDFAAQLAGNGAGEVDTEIEAEFDRFLAAHDAQVAREALNGLVAQEAEHERLYGDPGIGIHSMIREAAEDFRDENYPEESPNV